MFYACYIAAVWNSLFNACMQSSDSWISENMARVLNLTKRCQSDVLGRTLNESMLQKT